MKWSLDKTNPCKNILNIPNREWGEVNWVDGCNIPFPVLWPFSPRLGRKAIGQTWHLTRFHPNKSTCNCQNSLLKMHLFFKRYQKCMCRTVVISCVLHTSHNNMEKVEYSACTLSMTSHSLGCTWLRACSISLVTITFIRARICIHCNIFIYIWKRLAWTRIINNELCQSPVRGGNKWSWFTGCGFWSLHIHVHIVATHSARTTSKHPYSELLIDNAVNVSTVYIYWNL